MNDDYLMTLETPDPRGDFQEAEFAPGTPRRQRVHVATRWYFDLVAPISIEVSPWDLVEGYEVETKIYG